MGSFSGLCTVVFTAVHLGRCILAIRGHILALLPERCVSTQGEWFTGHWFRCRRPSAAVRPPRVSDPLIEGKPSFLFFAILHLWDRVSIHYTCMFMCDLKGDFSPKITELTYLPCPNQIHTFATRFGLSSERYAFQCCLQEGSY